MRDANTRCNTSETLVSMIQPNHMSSEKGTGGETGPPSGAALAASRHKQRPASSRWPRKIGSAGRSCVPASCSVYIPAGDATAVLYNHSRTCTLLNHRPFYPHPRARTPAPPAAREPAGLKTPRVLPRAAEAVAVIGLLTDTCLDPHVWTHQRQARMLT